jgi:molybdopterin converting factor subunit 1
MRDVRVRLLYFAILRDIAGTSAADVELPDGARAADVWEQLRGRHRELAGYQRPPMVAVNEEYVAAEHVLRDGDELAFIPPVAGG